MDEGSTTAFHPDRDGDGYGDRATVVQACSAPPGHLADGTDCNDYDPALNPGMVEVCNGLDDDCDDQPDDGLTTDYFYDYDGDGFGNPLARYPYCVDPGPPFVLDSTDCDDTNAFIHPGVPEICNGFDDDCDGISDNDCNYLTLESILDVGGDQGRNVRLRWVRAIGDSAVANGVVSYSVWRRIAPGMAPAGAASPRAETTTATRAGSDGAPDPTTMAFPPGEWDFVASVPAFGEQRYTMVAQTLCDSNAAALCWSVFLVRAHRTPASLYEDAPLDSGYSVDNIVPGVPQNLIGTSAGGGHVLDWSDSIDPDFQYFRVYRSNDHEFVPGPENLAHQTAVSGWTDPSETWVAYKVTTVDANGNESAPAATAILVSVGDGSIAALELASLVPNPFRKEVTCSILVPAGGTHVEVRIHDLAGRMVRTLAASRLAAGRHTLVWDGRDAGGRMVAPGIYLVRLAGNGVTSVRSVAFTP